MKAVIFCQSLNTCLPELHVLATLRYANVLSVELGDVLNVTLIFLKVVQLGILLAKKIFHKIFHIIKTLLII